MFMGLNLPMAVSSFSRSKAATLYRKYYAKLWNVSMNFLRRVLERFMVEPVIMRLSFVRLSLPHNFAFCSATAGHIA
jgi:hypothetical protein